MVYVGENPIYKWMITGGTPMTQETTILGLYYVVLLWAQHHGNLSQKICAVVKLHIMVPVPQCEL